jgi:hypothetical protein
VIAKLKKKLSSTLLQTPTQELQDLLGLLLLEIKRQLKGVAGTPGRRFQRRQGLKVILEFLQGLLSG